MKVAHVTACYASRDGVGNTLSEKIEASLAFGHQVRVFVEAGAPAIPEKHRHLGVHADLADLVDERAGGPSTGFFEQDVAVYQFLHPYPLLRSALLRDRGAVLFEVPGFTPVEHYRHEEHFRRLQQQLDAVLPHLDLADAVLVHSRSMAGEVAALRPGIEARLRVLHPGVNSTLLAEASLEGRPAGPGPRLLYVGRYAGNKRLDLLVEAFARLRREHPAAELWVVGDRESPPYDRYGRELDVRLRELGLQAAVRQLGRPEDDALPAIYGAVDLFATASLHEGFCLPAAEAMTCGLPVVGFATTALPEVVGEGGILATEVGDPEALAAAMGRALAARPRLAEAARAQARGFSRDSFRARYRALLEQQAEAARGRERAPARRQLMEAVARTPVFYRAHSDWPVVGPLLAALRRRFTLHFEKYYVRKMQRLQGLYNQLALDELAELRQRVERLEAERRRLEEGR